jgi:hypothetical protein
MDMNTVTAHSHTEWLTPGEAAGRLGVSSFHLNDLAQAKRLEYVIANGTRRFNPASIDAYLALPSVIARRAWQSKSELLEVKPASGGIGTRWPLHPLLAAVEADSGRPVSILEVARQLGVEPGALYRGRHEGLTTVMADRFAIGIDRHPSRVWGELWWVVDVESEPHDEADVPAPRMAAWLAEVEAQRARRRHPSSHRRQVFQSDVPAA